jgi:hypothetical protein
MTELTLEILRIEAREFAKQISSEPQKTLFGVDNGKAIGTHVEQGFVSSLAKKYSFDHGNAAKGIDFPGLNIDVKVTSVVQPQSSSPFRSARQKIFGLGYGLLLFVYQKHDDQKKKTGRLEILHTVFIDEKRTADFTITKLLREMLMTNANEEDLIALMSDRNLPLDSIEAVSIAQELLMTPPEQGYLTISNAFQWRLQYARALIEADHVEGLIRL